MKKTAGRTIKESLQVQPDPTYKYCLTVAEEIAEELHVDWFSPIDWQIETMAKILEKRFGQKGAEA